MQGMDRTNDRKAARWELIALGGLVVLAAALRMARIDAREPWLDEACTALISGRDLSDLAEVFTGESNPPLYYALLLAWQKVAGNAPWALRLPSVLAGVALVPMVWAFARRVGAGSVAALAGAFLAAASPVLLFYSLEARAYLLLWCLAFGAVIAMDDVIRRPGRSGPVILAAALGAAALYTHYYGVFLLPLWGIAWCAVPAGRARRRVGLGAAATLMAWAPWAGLHLVSHVGHHGQAWLEQFAATPWAMLVESVSILCLVPPFPAYLGELGALGRIPGHAELTGLWIGVPVIGGALGIWGAARRGTAPGGPGRARAALLTAAVLLPVLGALVVSLVRPIYLPGRYELMACPPFLVLWALGIQGLLDGARGGLRRWAQGAVVVLTLAAVGPLSGAWLLDEPAPPHHRNVAGRVHEAPKTEGVVSVGLLWAPVEYPLRRLGDVRRHLSHPREIAAEHPGWLDLSLHDESGLRGQAAETLSELADGPGIWVIVGLGPGGAMAQPQLVGTLWGILLAAGWVPGPPEVHGPIGLVRFRPRHTETE